MKHSRNLFVPHVKSVRTQTASPQGEKPLSETLQAAELNPHYAWACADAILTHSSDFPNDQIYFLFKVQH